MRRISDELARTLSAAHHSPDFRNDFFDVIDTETKAYWLGFILADGCVVRDTVAIKLAARDSSHLELFRAEVRTAAAVRFYWSKRQEMETGQIIEPSLQAKLPIGSVAWVAALARLGIGERKSMTAVPPAVAVHLERHLWRGIFDGDGSLTVRQQGGREKAVVQLCGSRPTVEGFVRYVAANTTCDRAVKARKITRKENVYSIGWNGCHLPRQIVQLLYKGATVSLDRKRIIAERIMALESRYADTSGITAAVVQRLKEELGSVSAAAGRLGIERTTAYKILKR